MIITTQFLHDLKIEHSADETDDSYRYIHITLPNGVLIQHKLTVEGLIVDVFDKFQEECIGTMFVMAEDLEPEPEEPSSQIETLKTLNERMSDVKPPVDHYAEIPSPNHNAGKYDSKF